MNPRRRASGFTLIEIIVVIALMAIVTTIGCVIFHKMFSAISILTEKIDLDNRAETAFNEIRRDFDQILSAELSGVPLRGEFAIEEGRDQDNLVTYGRALDSDRIIIPVQRVAGGARQDQPGKVMYWVDREGTESALVRTHGPLDEPEPTQARTVVQPNVVGLRIEYAPRKSTEWQREWDRPDLPGAVRVSLALAGDHPLEQVARKAVFVIRCR